MLSYAMGTLTASSIRADHHDIFVGNLAQIFSLSKKNDVVGWFVYVI